MSPNDMQKIREEVVKALGQATKSPNGVVAAKAFAELVKIKTKVFRTA